MALHFDAGDNRFEFDTHAQHAGALQFDHLQTTPPADSAPADAAPADERMDSDPVADSVKIGEDAPTLAAAGNELREGEDRPLLSESERSARAAIRALAEKTLAARPSSDTELLERAFAFASEKHAGQKRRTGEDYIEHPIAVAGLLAELGMDDITLAAGLLHDVPEDCGVTSDEMTERFGPEVTLLVDGVTKLKKVEFSTAEEKQAENLRKLFLAMAGDVRVIIIKLADRLHNMRTLDPFPEQRKREISAETLHILAPIAHRWASGASSGSWKTAPSSTWSRTSTSRSTRSSRKRGCSASRSCTRDERFARASGEREHPGRGQRAAQALLLDLPEDAQAGAAVRRHPRPDALRVICNSVRIATTRWASCTRCGSRCPRCSSTTSPGPKPNNYQSLHTKVLAETATWSRVQIRTWEMHREAEFGIAAHWRYKEGDKPSQNFGDKLRWLRLVLELQSDTQGDAQSFLDSLKLDLSADQVFAFTPRGDVIYLPQGSTPVDFAFRIHSEVGNACVGAKVNGRIVPLNHKLHNGDICEVITSRGSKGPKRGWLDFVVTPHAKNRIKTFLKKHSFEDNYREGMQRLEKAAQVERLKLGSLATNEMLGRVARNLHLRGLPELLAAIGYGEYSAEGVLKRVRAEMQQDRAREDEKKVTLGDGVGLSGAAEALLQRKMPLETETATRGTLQLAPLTADGGRGHSTTGNFLYSLGKCCAPIPGDSVKGYITRGRGVTVHRVACSNLKHYEQREPDRLLDAQWTPDPERSFQVLVALEASDRTGLLQDVSTLFTERRINIAGLNTYPLKNNRARMNIAATVRDSSELDDLMSALRSVVGVYEVHRV
jgi:GTP pyrophosphokinase